MAGPVDRWKTFTQVSSMCTISYGEHRKRKKGQKIGEGQRQEHSTIHGKDSFKQQSAVISSSIFALHLFPRVSKKPTCKSFRLTQAASFCNVSLCFYRNIYRSGGLGQTSVFSSLCLCKAHNDCKKQKEKKSSSKLQRNSKRNVNMHNSSTHYKQSPQKPPQPTAVTTQLSCCWNSHPRTWY